jgi:hypothetical protein
MRSSYVCIPTWRVPRTNGKDSWNAYTLPICHLPIYMDMNQLAVLPSFAPQDIVT